jgi:hypothetical protein
MPLSSRRAPTPSRLLMGWREWVALPELGAERVNAKIDTGARTSAIHAFDIETFDRRGARWVRFVFHPLQADTSSGLACAARVFDERLVRSSSGHAERRLVIKTSLALGGAAWPIEVTLAQRDQMGFRMLIGRTALKGRAIIDPARSYLCRDEPPPKPPRRGGGSS